jgi:membrane-bound lytic murein transglycosylase D
MTTQWFQRISLPLTLSICLAASPAWAKDTPEASTETETTAPTEDISQEAPLPECVPAKTKAKNTKRRKGKRKRKGPEILPVDDSPGLDAQKPKTTADTAKDESTPEATKAEDANEDASEVNEPNDDEWSPDSTAQMVAPKPKAPPPPADPLHFDKIDLASFDIPIEDNPEVRKWLTWFMGPGHDIYQRWLDRGYRYQPMMKAALKEAGLPTDLVYLSMIESGYQIKATSRASAGGLWQFMPATGERFNLKQDYWVDERYDPEKALGAAIKYLSFLYKRFDSWPIAWAAYNAGEGRLGKAIKYSGTRDFFEIAKTRYLVAETKRYVPKIMATAILGHYPELYGFRPAKTGEGLAYDVSRVEGSVELPVIAKCAGTTVKTITNLNPALKSFATPPSTYDLRLPVGTKTVFEAALAKVPKNKRLTTVRHKVRKGESLGKIATRYKTSVQAIIRANKIRNANRIYPGMRLTIPRTAEAAAALAHRSSTSSRKSSSTSPSSTRKTYTVRKGDILSKIASRYKLSVAQLKRYNGLKSDQILVGQSLRLVASTASTSKTTTTTHVVRKGDTLSQIAEKYGVGMSDLQRLNGIRSASSIQVGQKLKVKAASAAWQTYKVRAGDSLGLIATRNGCTVRDLKGWNKLNSTVIHPGQRLRIRK